MDGRDAAYMWLIFRTARFCKSLPIPPDIVSMSTNWIENERFWLVLVKTIIFKLKTGFKNPSTGHLWQVTVDIVTVH